MAQKRVLTLLCQHANKSNQCWQSVSTLAREAGASTRTLFRVLKALEEYGVLHRQKRLNKGGGRGSTLYTVYPEKIVTLNSDTGNLCLKDDSTLCHSVSTPMTQCQYPHDTVAHKCISINLPSNVPSTKRIDHFEDQRNDRQCSDAAQSQEDTAFEGMAYNAKGTQSPSRPCPSGPRSQRDAPDKKLTKGDGEMSNKKKWNPTPEQLEAAFEDFWNRYPRKIGKKKAFRCFQARLKEGADPVAMVIGAQYYAETCEHYKTKPEYIKHPGTFLGPNEHYLDYAGGPEIYEAAEEDDKPKFCVVNPDGSRSPIHEFEFRNGEYVRREQFKKASDGL